MKRVLWLVLPLALAASACDKKKEEKPEAKPAVQSLSDKEIENADLPVKEEFEMKARAAINEKNVEKQVDALEKEINQDTK